MSTRNYEAMFILDNNAATANFEETSGQVDAILEKHGATIVQKEKWDERKLAYEIKGQRRGTYYLTYFNAAPSAIQKIDEDVQLSETILRHLVIAFEGPVDEYIANLAAERERMAEDSRNNSLGGWGGGRRGDQRRGPPARKPEPAKTPAPGQTPTPAQAETPVAVAVPATEAPAAEAPVTEAPATEAPVTEAVAVEKAAPDTTATQSSETKSSETESSTKTEASAES